MQQEIIDVLLKKAKGYTYDEQQDEYTVREDGEMVLIRRKIAKKYSLPDSGALRMYLDICGEREIETYTDEELLNARESLRKELFEYMKEEYNKNLSKKEEQEENSDSIPVLSSDNNAVCNQAAALSVDSTPCNAFDTPFTVGNVPCDVTDTSFADNSPAAPSDAPCDAPDIQPNDSKSCDTHADPSEKGVSCKNAGYEEANGKNISKNVFSNDSRYEVTDATLTVGTKAIRAPTVIYASG